MNNKKKIIIICSMVVLLIAAGYINILLNNEIEEPKGDEQVTSVSFFCEYRTDRETARAQQFTYLDAIIADEDSTQQSKDTAETMKIDLVGAMESELILEGLIKARGFKDAVVTLTSENVNVIVQDEQLESAEVAQILTIITDETGTTAGNVIIVPYSST